MKISKVDLKPTEAMANAAARGLRLREKYGRGGTAVGVARARDLKNRATLSPSTVKRMHSFFSRHDGNQSGGEDDAGFIAWLLWGGNSGQSWAKRKVRELDAEEAEKSVKKHCPPWVFQYLDIVPKQNTPSGTLIKADIVKKDEQQIIYGVVLSPHTVGDSQGDVVPAHEIENACYNYMKSSRVIKFQHMVPDDESFIVESWIEPYPTSADRQQACEMKPHRAYRRKFGNQDIMSGDWVMGVKLSDPLWKMVKSNELTGFSIGGQGARQTFKADTFPKIEYIPYS